MSVNEDASIRLNLCFLITFNNNAVVNKNIISKEFNTKVFMSLEGYWNPQPPKTRQDNNRSHLEKVNLMSNTSSK